METQEFITQLDEAQDFMANEKYKEAILILEKLKKIDKEGNFDYNLSHRLYQLLSNSHSLFNQQNILRNLKILSKREKSIDFEQLNKILREEYNLEIDNTIIRREIELLILRKLLDCKIEGNNLIFQ